MAQTDTGMIYGSIDILSALFILISSFVAVWGDFLIILTVLLIVKAILNYHKFPTPLNPVAALDMVTAFILVMLYFGFSSSIFLIPGFLQLIKGGFAFMVGAIPEK